MLDIFGFFGFGGGGGGAAAPQSPDATNSSLDATPAAVEDGSVTVITVTARDAANDPIEGATIALTTDETGSFGAASGVTNALGLYITTYIPSGVGSGTHTISADITSNAVTIAESDTVTVSAGNRMVEMTGAPTDCIGVVVTPERFVFALGAGGDARKVQWPSRETLDDWTPSATNTAGDFILEGNGSIRCGARGRGETLIWTDNELFAARYIGGVLVYSFERLGTNCGIIAPNAKVVLDGTAIWMGPKGFFMYDGFVRPVPCEVFDYVFSDFNFSQRAKVWAQPISQYGEVRFHYPSATATECDRYVTWNFRENHWSLGELARTAGIDRGAFSYPLASAPDGVTYHHERGDSRDGMTPSVESGPVELDTGERIMRILRIIPDEQTLGDMTAYLYTAMYPTEDETENGPYTLAAPTDVRLSAREVRLKLQEARATDWRVGIVKLDLKAGGKR